MINNEFSIKSEKKRLIIGLVLIFIGIIAPIFVNVYNFKVYDLLYESINYDDTGMLLVGALSLVVLNSVRGLPHYLGTFIIVESISIEFRGETLPHIKGFISLIIIPLVYSLINTIHNIKYDLGVPAFIVIFAIMYLEKMDFEKITIIKKAFIIILLLFGVQWLDIIPGISFLKFGRGETSQDIKMIADIIEGREILTIFGSLFFFVFTFAAIIVAKLINDENKIIVANEKNKRVEKELNEVRISDLQDRYNAELKHIVHDLKTPITSSMALISVIRMMDETFSPKIQKYLERIEKSLDNQNEMISEILYKDKKSILTCEELFSYIFSHISPLVYAQMVLYNNDSKDAMLNVNKINFTRAIINILDNSYNAVDEVDGHIWINIYSVEDRVYIEIRDNGIGIKEERMEVIKKSGVSGRKSTGIGLTFIKDVIDDHDGEMIMTSEYGVGTMTKIILIEVKE